jgi:hypothetical protein
VDGKTALKRLADVVLKHATRWRQLQQTADAADAGTPGLAREAGEQAAVEGQHLVLMAQCLFFVAFLRERAEAPGVEHVAASDVAAILVTLADLSSGAFAASACIESTALAVLFAALAVLERGKLSAQGCLSLQSSVHFLPDRRDARSALLRLALALSSEPSSEALLQTACDDGAFGYLLDLVQSPAFQVRRRASARRLQRHARVAHARAARQDEARGDDAFGLMDAYVLTAHSLVTSFLKDDRGRNQARCA